MANKASAADQTRTIPWSYGQSSFGGLLDRAYERGHTLSVAIGANLGLLSIGGQRVGFTGPSGTSFIRWPAIDATPVPAHVAEHMRADKDAKGRCYFIGRQAGPVKIGYSIDVPGRFQAIQSCSPIKLSVLATVAGGETRERAYHMQFEAFRLHGEWFERCPEIEVEIERLNAAHPTESSHPGS